MARQSILDYFLESAEHYPSRTAVLVKNNGSYQPMQWKELGTRTTGIARGLLNVGVNVGDRICIVSHTRVEWVLCDMAILYAGGITVPIYPSNLPDECQYIVENSGASIIIAEDAQQTQKFRAERSRLGKVKKVIQISGEIGSDDGWVISLQQLEAEAHADETILASRRKAIDKDAVATLIYTSGTTGRPKGVMITHDNLAYEAEAIAQLDVVRDTDVQLLFLPLAHVFAKVLMIAWLSTRHQLAFAESMNTLAANMAEVRPTLMAGVPRVFEKFYGAVNQKARSAGGLSSKLFGRAALLSERQGDAALKEKRLPALDALQYKLLKTLVFAKVGRGLTGIFGGRMRVLVSGGAPLSPKIAWFFRDAGVEILEGFGLTETTAASCVNRLGSNVIGAVGLPLPGTEVKVANDGELLIRGRGVMKGYWDNSGATAEVLQDGWFHTGDVGTVSGQGIVRIVDRKKDIIITAGGKNVAPQNIENLLKTDQLISQVVVHGDKRKFLTALVTLDPDALKGFAQSHGLGAGSYAEMTQKPEVQKAVQSAFESFNKQLASYESVKKFKILEHDFSQESGELTPSLKIRRKLVNQRYKSTFDSFYDESF